MLLKEKSRSLMIQIEVHIQFKLRYLLQLYHRIGQTLFPRAHYKYDLFYTFGIFQLVTYMAFVKHQLNPVFYKYMVRVTFN